MEPIRHCAHCGEPLPPNAADAARYCSHSCRTAAYRVRNRERIQRARIDAAEPDGAPTPPPISETEAAALITELAMCAVGIEAASKSSPTFMRPMLSRIAHGTADVLRREGLEL